MTEPTSAAPYACHDCGERFPRTTAYFHRGGGLKDGLSSVCKACGCGRAAASRAQLPPADRPRRFQAQTYESFLVWWRAHPRRGGTSWIDGLLQVQARKYGGYRPVILRDGQPVADEADGAA